MEYDKGKIEGHKLKIQEILNTLNAHKSSSPDGDNAVSGGHISQSLPIDSDDVVMTSASESGKSCPRFPRLHVM